MLKRALNFAYGIRDRQRILIALAKGGAMRQAREIDLKEPDTWEFSGFSQNGEDGILDVLRSQLIESNSYFIEIGAADGIDNNSAWLTIAEKMRGLMVEGSKTLTDRAKRMVLHYTLGLRVLHLFVKLETVEEIWKQSQYPDPDIMSLDIDGNDYYIARELFKVGFRPKIFVVEYNSVFGPSSTLTIKYDPSFVYSQAHPSELYYGVSVAGWRKFFDEQGYKFVTVDRNGVNAFFVAPEFFSSSFLEKIKPTEYRENQLQFDKFRCNHEGQFKQIEQMSFVEI